MLALLWWLIIGLLAGAIARLLIPGRQPMGLLMTMILGLVGSIIGGLISWLLVGGAGPDQGFHPAGLFLSILGAVVVLGIYVAYVQPQRVM
ncbi:hypothetical protein AYO44_14740 [Planctomycetaceae bacterium SCGC AG-212-F19]|nr:hypothetical protein AYO44_14740 [Planctomycetaceae bacterium SCGC AG-212-F19]